MPSLPPEIHARDAWQVPPPMRRTRMENHPTLLVSWWCTGCALVLILARLWGRLVRTEKLFLEDKIMALSIIPLFIRIALVDPIMLWGTNNVVTTGISLESMEHRMTGSKLVLASRIFYALFIWMAKFTVSEYLRRMTSTFWTRAHQRVLFSIRVFLIVTFFAVVIATFGECQPFDHYWQVVPDPGPDCRSGYAQLFVMSICDIITDVLLIAFPISIVVRSSMPLRRKLTVSALFGLSVILVVITSYRVAAIVHSGGRQQLRTLWASLEILAAAAVSNALILGSFVRDRGVKKSKYKGPANGTLASTAASEPQSHIVRKMTTRHWGNDSDENLFASLRGRLDSTCEHDANATPAPMAGGILRPFTGRYRDELPSSAGSFTPRLERYNSQDEAVELMDVGGILSDRDRSLSSSNGPKISGDSRAPLNRGNWAMLDTASDEQFMYSPASNAFDFADPGGLLSRAQPGSSDGGPVAVTTVPKPPIEPATTYSNRGLQRIPPPLQPPPLKKNDSSLSAASAESSTQQPRRPSVASSQQTDDSTGESRAVALDMLAKIREARERAQAGSSPSQQAVLASAQGRLFGEVDEPIKPG